MKTSFIIAAAIALAAVAVPAGASGVSPARPQAQTQAQAQAQTEGAVAANLLATRTDSIARATRMHNLKQRREKLETAIRAEDQKRNRQIAGVSAEAIEEMNNRQDSVCLALRSQLVDVTLEIKELTTTVQAPALVNQVNQLINPAPAQPAQQPATNGGRRQPAKRHAGAGTGAK